jgi:hypothetical protein
LFIRFHPDGAVDNTFMPESDIIGNLDFQFWPLADTKLLLGAWNQVGGSYQLRRLTPGGAPDPSFDPAINLVAGTTPRFHPLSDGSILDCSFPKLNRLGQDGSLDPLFAGRTAGAPNFTGSGVNQVIELDAGKLLITGRFPNYNGVRVNGIVRVLADGSIDPTFRSGQGFEFTLDPASSFFVLHALPHGRFLAEGTFNRYDGQAVTPFAPIVLNPDGTREPSFEGPGEVEWVWGRAPVYFLTVAGDNPIVWTPAGLTRLVPPPPPPSPEPPRVVSIERTGEVVRLVVAVQPGRLYTLETSPDFADWSAATSQTAASAEIEFTDTPPAGTRLRFYRVAEE